jgi:hypothetical protein
MTEATIIYNTVVVLAFLAQAYNYVLLGKGNVNRTLYLFVLSCFIFIESWIAVERPVMWLWVSLNIWGALNLLKGKTAERER